MGIPTKANKYFIYLLFDLTLSKLRKQNKLHSFQDGPFDILKGNTFFG